MVLKREVCKLSDGPGMQTGVDSRDTCVSIHSGQSV